MNNEFTRIHYSRDNQPDLWARLWFRRPSRSAGPKLTSASSLSLNLMFLRYLENAEMATTIYSISWSFYLIRVKRNGSGDPCCFSMSIDIDELPLASIGQFDKQSCYCGAVIQISFIRTRQRSRSTGCIVDATSALESDPCKARARLQRFTSDSRRRRKFTKFMKTTLRTL